MRRLIYGIRNRILRKLLVWRIGSGFIVELGTGWGFSLER